MARYLASAGIRGSTASLATVDAYPFVVIVGPSGQFAQIIAPSSYAGKIPAATKSMVGYANSASHVPLAFCKNEILYSVHSSYAANGSQLNYAWMPYGQPSTTPKINPEDNCIVFDATTPLEENVMFDGFQHKMPLRKFVSTDAYNQNSYLKIPGGACFYIGPIRSFGSYAYGLYKGKDPEYRVSGITSGWIPLGGEFGGTYETNFQPVSLGHDGYSYGGVEYYGNDPANYDETICDMVYHKGVIYFATQILVGGIVPGTKGNYLFYDYPSETGAPIGEAEDYVSRAVQATYGPHSKSFAIHKDNLYMLQGNGKVFSVSAAGIRLLADITTIGTPWSSGIFGGIIKASVPPNTARRCYMASFNNQLHAFLNYSTFEYKVAKGTEGAATGKGIFWATSHDGVNWIDRTDKLPGSGILPSSGSLGQWLLDIAPYKISGYCGYNRSQYSVWQAIASGTSLSFSACKPSGLQQATKIPILTSSGLLVDTPGTAWDALKLPLTKGVVSAFLAPTWVQKPSAYQTIQVSGVKSFVPKTVGPSGYDFTGCHNYHISGFTDDDQKVLHLMFSEDYHGINASDTGKVLYYKLNKGSGWERKNYLPQCNQLSGLIPVDLYDPEILVPSGDAYNPNPRVDEVNKKITCDFYVYDWPFWSSVNVKMEYSTDGYSWHSACGLRSVSTGSKESDPSGVIGVKHTITWDYSKTLNSNTDYPYLQLRLRATEV